MDFESDWNTVEEEVMIEIEGIYEWEEKGDLLDRLVAETPMAMSGSSNYSYRPAPFEPMDIEEEHDFGLMIPQLKITNMSSSSTDASAQTTTKVEPPNPKPQ